MLRADYLIVGAGASGLAFADIIASRSDRTMVIVDRHDRPGGHWNDAYSFVRLHQPSAFYGVDSLELSDGSIDVTGPNAGMQSLATGAQVSAYFEQVMRERLLPTGRVTYFPHHEVEADGTVRSLADGAACQVEAKRTVDTTYYDTAVPSTHPPLYRVEAGTRLATPNDLPGLWAHPDAIPYAFVVVGAGKTATDTASWLLSAGVDPAAIHWVRPRDSWFYNRERFQSGANHAASVLDGQVDLFRALGEARDIDDLYERLEDSGYMLRIDRACRPGMFHYATCSEAEVGRLATIESVIRQGRVSAVSRGRIEFDDGSSATVPDDALMIDCTARAIAPRPALPIWQDGRITIQMVRAAQPAFSAALIAFLDLVLPDDAARNVVARPIPIPQTAAGFVPSTLVNLMNQHAWMQDERIRDFILSTRLDGFARSIAGLAERDATARDKLGELRALTKAAVPNMQRLAGQ